MLPNRFRRTRYLEFLIILFLSFILWIETPLSCAELLDTGFVTLSPQKDKIVFCTGPRNSTSNSIIVKIWLTNISTGSLKLLSPKIDLISPIAWSPDGTKIAYFRRLPKYKRPFNRLAKGELVIQEVENSSTTRFNIKNLYSSCFGIECWGIAWLSENVIAFQGGYGLTVLPITHGTFLFDTKNRKESELTRLPPDALSECSIGASPNEKILYITREISGDKSDIIAVSLDTRKEFTIIGSTFGCEGTPILSPNEENILFIKKTDKLNTPTSEIYIVDTNGKNLKKIYSCQAHIRHPIWSFDQKNIFFVTYQRRNNSWFSANWRFNIKDGKVSQIKQYPNGDIELNGTVPDGRILFTRNGKEIWFINPDGNNARQIFPEAAK